MRNPWVTASLSILTVVAAGGCSATPDDGDRPAPRRDRPSLLAGADELRGSAVIETEEGPWRVRHFDRPTVDGGRPIDSEGAIMLGATPTSRADGPAADRSVATIERLASKGEGDVAGAPEPTGPSSPGPSARRRGGEPGAGGATRAPGPLRAGATDDNDDHAGFVKYLDERLDKLKGRCQPLAVKDRRVVTVVDRNGAPLPGAEVVFVDEDKDAVVWRGTTYGDGSFLFFPGELPEGAPETWLLEVRHGDRFLRQHWNGEGGEFVVKMPRAAAGSDAVDLDVVFLIDTTGSMGDEIEAIKTTLLSVTGKLRNLDREFDLRYGAVLYRDVTDAYVTKAHAFTDDLEAFDKALQGIEATGGGDTPESLNQGLAVAVDGMEWRQGAAKLVFLIADAPPHMDYENDVPYGASAKAAVARGIKVHAVAASGLDEAGTLVFRQIAQFTRGKFIFIEYGGDVKKTAEGHGVTGPVKGNNLDDILFEQIRDEVAGWGRS